MDSEKPDVARSVRIAFATLSLSIGCVSLPTLAGDFASPANASPPDKIAYHICTGGPSAGCQDFPGDGVPVCEHFVKMLNAYGAEAHPTACEVSLHPAFPEFSEPEWEDLDIQKNINLVYRIDRSINPLVESNKRRRELNFQQWQELFEKEIAGGQSKPRLRRTTLRSSNGKPVAVFSYVRNDDCNQDVIKAHRGFSRTGGVLFMRDETNGELVHTPQILQPGWPFGILRFSNAYYLVRTEFYPPTAESPGLDYVGVYSIDLERGLSSEIPRYTPIRQCQIRAEFSKLGDAGSDH